MDSADTTVDDRPIVVGVGVDNDAHPDCLPDRRRPRDRTAGPTTTWRARRRRRGRFVCGAAALALAADLAARLGSRLVAVHAWNDIVVESDGSGRRSHEDEPVLAARAATLLDAELAEIALAHPGLPVERSVVAGTPFRALLAAADGARLLVVGHRGNVTGPGRRIGSTSLALVEFVPVSGRGDRARGRGRAGTAPCAGHRGNIVTAGWR